MASSMKAYRTVSAASEAAGTRNMLRINNVDDQLYIVGEFDQFCRIELLTPSRHGGHGLTTTDTIRIDEIKGHRARQQTTASLPAELEQAKARIAALEDVLHDAKARIAELEAELAAVKADEDAAIMARYENMIAAQEIAADALWPDA